MHKSNFNLLQFHCGELESKMLPCLGHIKLVKLSLVQILSFLNTLLEDGVRKDASLEDSATEHKVSMADTKQYPSNRYILAAPP